MKKLLRVVGWILGVCAYLAITHPRVTFTAKELALPPVPLPRGFLSGTATSAHQVEGGNTNNWTASRPSRGRSNAARRARSPPTTGTGWRKTSPS